MVFEGAVAVFLEAMKEHGSLEGVMSFAFVEAGVRAAAQGGIADPGEREQRTFQAADFLERLWRARSDADRRRDDAKLPKGQRFPP